MKDNFDTLVQAIQEVIKTKTFVLIAIDGRGGSGKSTLAKKLQTILPRSIVLSADDFYIPGRVKNKVINEDDFNLDWQRLEQQLLLPLHKKQPAQYQRYDWNTDILAEWHTVQPNGIIILEGGFTLLPELLRYYDYTIWVEEDKTTCLQRGIQRDIGYIDAVNKWTKEIITQRWDRFQKMEDMYMQKYNPQNKAAFVFKRQNITPELDQKTLQLEALLLQIAAVAQKHNKQYYFGGGFAIDLTFGGLTRAHSDLDFYPMETDTQWWKEWFAAQGYIVSKDTDMENLLNAFSVLGKNNEYYADVYPNGVDNNGDISMAVKEGTKEVWDGMLTIHGNRGIWKGKLWHDVKKIDYKGQAVFVENYKTVLQQKETYIQLHPGKTLSEKHLHDFARAGIKPQI